MAHNFGCESVAGVLASKAARPVPHGMLTARVGHRFFLFVTAMIFLDVD